MAKSGSLYVCIIMCIIEGLGFTTEEQVVLDDDGGGCLYVCMYVWV
jgi:hypothetical protein